MQKNPDEEDLEHDVHFWIGANSTQVYNVLVPAGQSRWLNFYSYELFVPRACARGPAVGQDWFAGISLITTKHY